MQTDGGDAFCAVHGFSLCRPLLGDGDELDENCNDENMKVSMSTIHMQKLTWKNKLYFSTKRWRHSGRHDANFEISENKFLWSP